MFNLQAIQSAIREFGFDAWLLYDFRGNNPMARRVLDMTEMVPASRRWFYLIPAEGEPRKLNHGIEKSALAHLPGDQAIYVRWQELEKEIDALCSPFKKIAMEYSPRNGNPYVSVVDGGTIAVGEGDGESGI